MSLLLKKVMIASTVALLVSGSTMVIGIALSASTGGGATLTIDGAQQFQTIDGFGVNVNSASWNNGELRPVLDMLVDQLGATIFRVVIDNGDWESSNDDSDPNTFNEVFYNNVYTSPKFEALWGTIAYLNQKGITQNLVLSVMGPVAAWMGGSHINASAEDEWVEMIASLIAYARHTRNLQFGLLSPMNEPDWDGIEGPQVDQWQYARLMQKLSQRLDGLGLAAIRLVGPDTAAVTTGVQAYFPEMLRNTTLMAKLAHFGLHNYAGSTAGAAQAIAASAFPNKNFWMTEVSNIWDAIPEITQGAAATLVWDAFDSVYNHAILAGRGTNPPNDAGNGPALLAYNSTTGTYTPRRAFYEHAQLFKYVTPGARRISASGSNTNLMILAFHHPSTNRLTIVGRNTGSGNLTIAGFLANLPAPSAFQLYLTDISTNMQRRADVVVSGNAFTWTVTGGSTFTLTTTSAPPPPDAIRPSAPSDLAVTPLAPSPGGSIQVHAAWVAPTTSVDGTLLSDLAGYRLYYGPNSGAYTASQAVGNQTTYTLSGLVGGQTYYFAVSALDTSGNESAFSSPEASATTLTDTPLPPVASFTGTPTTGSAPLNVAFTDVSTGQITAWSWSFGDNSSSAQSSPQHTYASVGTYTVSLTVSGPGGSNTITRPGYITATVPPPPPPSTGLVAAYGFNDGTGSTVTDASGNGNHGTISGAQWTSSGQYGKALVFDGVNDWVTVADSPSLDLTTGMTLQAWVYPTALSGGSANGWRTVILKQQSTQLAYALYANSNTNRPNGYVYTSSDQGVFGNAQLPLNTWRHLAVTYDGAALKLYVGGTLVGNRALPGIIKTSGHPLRIGGNSIWGEYFKGRIDEVRIYNRALTAAQIQADMSTPVAPSGGAALTGLASPAMRLPGPLRSRQTTGKGAAVDLVQGDTDVKRTLPLRRAGASSETSTQDIGASVVQPHLIEAGEVQVTSQWQRLDFRAAFADPIVIANAMSRNGGAPAVIRIRQVGPTGFDIRVQRWHDAEGEPPSAVVGFLALERGTYTLVDGTLIEAGSVEVARSGTSPTSETMPFRRRFNAVPVVMTAVTSFNESKPVTGQLQAISKSSLRFRLDSEVNAFPTSSTETLSYIAWESSAGTLQGIAFEVHRTPGIGRKQLHPLAFLRAFDTPPIVLAEVQGATSGSPLTVHWDVKDTSGVGVTLEAGLGAEDEHDTPTDVVGYIALQ